MSMRIILLTVVAMAAILAEEESTAENDVLTLTAQPQSLSRSTSLSYSDGAIERTNHNVRLQVAIDISPLSDIIGYEDLEFTKAVFNTDEEVILSNDRHSRSSMFNTHHRGRNQSISASLSLPSIPDDASHLAHIAGSFTALIPSAELLIAEVPNLNDYVGKQVRIVNMEYAIFRIKEVDENRIQVEFSSSLVTHLDQFELLNAQGRSIETSYAGGSSGGHSGMATRYYRFSDPLPETVILRLHLFESITKQPAVFTLQDVPLVSVEETQDMVEIEAAPAQPAPVPRRLDIELIEQGEDGANDL